MKTRRGCAGYPRRHLSSWATVLGGAIRPRPGKSTSELDLARRSSRGSWNGSVKGLAVDTLKQENDRKGKGTQRVGHGAAAITSSLGPVSKAYRAVDAHCRYRMRQWLCAKHQRPGSWHPRLSRRVSLTRRSGWYDWNRQRATSRGRKHEWTLVRKPRCGKSARPV